LMAVCRGASKRKERRGTGSPALARCSARVSVGFFCAGTPFAK